MVQFFSGYFVYMFSLLLVYISLATILQMQFGRTGIANFGLAGFWGFGMYAFGLVVLKLGVPFIPALIIAIVLTAAISLLIGRIILDLDAQSVLVGTLACSVIIEDLIISEKWLTNGVKGLGYVNIPFDAGDYTKFIYFLIILVFTILLIYYAKKVEGAPYGRLLLSIQDNEPLSRSLGKPTFRQKLIFFTFTGGLAGFFGALAAPLYGFLFPKHMGPDVTFILWIALILGARKRILGGLVGVLVTVGLFDVLLETVVPIPEQYAGLMYNAKYFLYGLLLVLILMFRPSGILGEQKPEENLMGTRKLNKMEG